MSTMRPDDHRRKWDKGEYQKKAQERLLSQTKGNEKNDEGMNVVPTQNPYC